MAAPFRLKCLIFDELRDISHRIDEGCVSSSFQVPLGELKHVAIGFLHIFLLICINLKVLLKFSLFLLLVVFD